MADDEGAGEGHLAMGRRVIQTLLSIILSIYSKFVIFHTKYTKRRLNDSTAHGESHRRRAGHGRVWERAGNDATEHMAAVA